MKKYRLLRTPAGHYTAEETVVREVRDENGHTSNHIIWQNMGIHMKNTRDPSEAAEILQDHIRRNTPTVICEFDEAGVKQ